MSHGDNVIHLPRPKLMQDEPRERGLYLRVGRNDHRMLLQLIQSGQHRFFGIVIDAVHADRHKALRAEAKKRNLDVILDPRTQPMATPGGYTSGMGDLSWGIDRPHRLDDFEGAAGRAQAERIVDFAVSNGFTQLLGPTHFLQDHKDPWIARDLAAMGHARMALDAAHSDIELVYPLSVPIDVLREPAYRRALIMALRDRSFDALWLKIDNFGHDASGEKTAAYIEACREFHVLGVPLIADQVGGLPGLGLVAFDGVGGIAHGITSFDSFKSYPWRNPPKRKGGGGSGARVYIPRLDTYLKPAEASALFNASMRIKGRFACTDTHCCNGVRGQLENPARHFLHQRTRELESIGATPDSLRAATYIDSKVRKVSDDVVALVGSEGLPESLAAKFRKKQKAISGFRDVMANLADADRFEPTAPLPKRLERRRST